MDLRLIEKLAKEGKNFLFLDGTNPKGRKCEVLEVCVDPCIQSGYGFDRSKHTSATYVKVRLFDSNEVKDVNPLDVVEDEDSQ